MKKLRVPLRVVFYRDGSDWVAHGLEFDLLGDGVTREQALARLAEAVSIQVETSLEHDNPDNLFSPADGKYFRMFAAGEDVAVGVLHIESGSVVIDAETREYSESDADLVTLQAS
jgi:predicted RNase H-like HicB family nuclease